MSEYDDGFLSGIMAGCDEAEQYLSDNILEPEHVPMMMAYSKYITNACIKLMKDTGMPAKDIDAISRNIDVITKNQVEEDFNTEFE
ncbi:MAG: hypothetical protein LBU81_05345 [Methanosarcinales archaeon]|jgi:hypothetical protein|nr:hypothetical protein [Methanosarcinales archaeon]